MLRENYDKWRCICNIALQSLIQCYKVFCYSKKNWKFGKRQDFKVTVPNYPNTNANCRPNEWTFWNISVVCTLQLALIKRCHFFLSSYWKKKISKINDKNSEHHHQHLFRHALLHSVKIRVKHVFLLSKMKKKITKEPDFFLKKRKMESK